MCNLYLHIQFLIWNFNVLLYNYDSYRHKILEFLYYKENYAYEVISLLSKCNIIYTFIQKTTVYKSLTIFLQPGTEHSIGVIKEADMDK
jgi:Fe2+ or Zn2+ uptake regulation protein